MQTYVETDDGHAAIRATRAEVSRLPQVAAGRWPIVPATKALRRAARLGVEVKTLRILPGGRIGYI